MNDIPRRKGTMDVRTSFLICLGAATAANCIPCFEHYHKKASAAGLTPEEILEAVELANKVKSGAHLLMRNCIRNFMGNEKPCNPCAGGPMKDSCFR
jgi:alkylhydroperoxidase/carboxymuconolactone decarboxylase family protein YurZ